MIRESLKWFYFAICSSCFGVGLISSSLSEFLSLAFPLGVSLLDCSVRCSKEKILLTVGLLSKFWRLLLNLCSTTPPTITDCLSLAIMTGSTLSEARYSKLFLTGWFFVNTFVAGEISYLYAIS